MESVTCGVCQFNIGKVIPLYKVIWEEVRRDYYSREQKDPNRDEIPIDRLTHRHDKKPVESGHILDMLDVKNECCRCFTISSYENFSPFD